MLPSGPPMAGMLTTSRMMRMNRNGDHATNALLRPGCFDDTSSYASSFGFSGPIRYCSGVSLRLFCHMPNAKVQTSETTAPTMTGRVGPMNFAAMYSGTKNDTPAIRVMGTMPLRPLSPPPAIVTMTNGQMIMKAAACRICAWDTTVASSAVRSETICVGTPTAPNMVVYESATRHMRMASTGLNPRANIMEAGMAMAVP